ncbi:MULTISPECIES: monofunctional biosynthetic peptidoglycan transglycosylase [unclassified Methylophaga]|uniref:monofunctional biosynthetic peptidoglycan transglycosylase n=1 Tax=unclassified Methylophaga TaxID=2629249 RepID=UPI000C8B0F76|nr:MULTISPECIES: monofunctional biosynthetic peptidoglycan transglycosylase [unclassified Methylophaga]MAK65641.1 monofunctional biosynthetic peptidoglycan transglycosylase [Methylophaga sp.]MAY16364.1 monofunctional biosynthetic peptidoglycan transglycosylase [Methylophaga sp.]MBN45136.1 monofunctional biosynthetic peptidoglycan transglycosylase [Methylophaga sp.]HCD06554.1 monofunctional biosynthetic peptidoglycan transglycosylase [Methylophaga sp.]|tara:strand:- start:43747 stop:44454 length:708 start_codon:yes stop_codon:yes gene_type:complete
MAVRRVYRFILRGLLQAILAFVLLSLLLVLPFRWVNPPITMVMADRWIHSTEDFELRQSWLSWEAIPKHAALAVVTSEDQKFPLHSGFDLKAIQQALKERERRGGLRGASTISQQVAKNMYLWTGRSWFRKGLEVWFTLLIELSWSKQRILEVYLNIAEWGPGVFGIEAASQYHFRLPAANLTPMQAALLASSLPSPLNYNPARPAQHLHKRAEWNLQQQRRLGGVQWLAPLNEK